MIRCLAHAIDPAISETRIQEATQARQRRFDHALIHVRDDILAALAQLRQRGIRLALISNASTAEVAAWDQSPLAELIDTAVFSCHCRLKKPDIRIF